CAGFNLNCSLSVSNCTFISVFPLDIYSSLLTLIVSILVLLLSGVVFIIFRASCSSTYSALIELNGPLFLPDELIFVKPTSLIFSPVLVTFLLVEYNPKISVGSNISFFLG